jgi:hypothetical protein
MKMKKCKVNNCLLKYTSSGYCRKHYTQLRRNGKISKRTRLDRNDYLIKGNDVEIFLYNMKGDRVGSTLVDLKHFNKCKPYKWCISNARNKQYCISNINGKFVSLARFILDAPKGYIVDHIRSEYTLDNRESNLRIVTTQQNSFNRRPYNSSKSGITGVRFDQQYNQWQAHIMFKYKRIVLGYYEKIDDAINARREAENKYFGEYAYCESQRLGIKKSLD